MQGQFRSRMFIIIQQVKDLQAEQLKGLWNTWALSSVDMSEDGAPMKNYQNQNLSTPGEKQNRAIKDYK